MQDLIGGFVLVDPVNYRIENRSLRQALQHEHGIFPCLGFVQAVSLSFLSITFCLHKCMHSSQYLFAPRIDSSTRYCTARWILLESNNCQLVGMVRSPPLNQKSRLYSTVVPHFLIEIKLGTNGSPLMLHHRTFGMCILDLIFLRWPLV